MDRAGTLEIYPSIDLRGGNVVRLAQGDFGRETIYDVDPAEVARAYADAGAGWLHVVDLDGAKAGRVSQADRVAAIVRAEPRLRVQAGGGVRSGEDVARLLDAGAARVVVGTKAVQDWPWLLDQLDLHPGRLTLAVDAKAGVVATHGWQETSGRPAADLAAASRGLPLAALLYTDVARDGMLGGTDHAGTAALADATDVPVLASGGVGSPADLRPLIASNVAGVVIGRAIYEGRIDLAAAVESGRGQGEQA